MWTRNLIPMRMTHRGPFLLLFATGRQLGTLLHEEMAGAPLTPDEFAVTSVMLLEPPVRPDRAGPADRAAADDAVELPAPVRGGRRRHPAARPRRRARQPGGAHGARRGADRGVLPGVRQRHRVLPEGAGRAGVPELDVIDTLEAVSRRLTSPWRRSRWRGRRRSGQRRVERDGRDGRERLAHRAVRLGVLGRGDEVVVAHARDGAADDEPDLGDAGAGDEVDLGRGVQRRSAANRPSPARWTGPSRSRRSARRRSAPRGWSCRWPPRPGRPTTRRRCRCRSSQGHLAGALEQAAFPVRGRVACSRHARESSRGPVGRMGG